MLDFKDSHLAQCPGLSLRSVLESPRIPGDRIMS